MGGHAIWLDRGGRQLGTIGSRGEREQRVVPTDAGYGVLLSTRLVHIGASDGRLIFEVPLEPAYGLFGSASLNYQGGRFWLATMSDETLVVSCVSELGERVELHEFSGVDYSNVNIVPLASKRALVLLDDGADNTAAQVLGGGSLTPVLGLDGSFVVMPWFASGQDVLLVQDVDGLSLFDLGTGHTEKIARGLVVIADVGDALLCRGAAGQFIVLDKKTRLLNAVRVDSTALALGSALEYYGAVGSNRLTGEVGVVQPDGFVRIVRLALCP